MTPEHYPDVLNEIREDLPSLLKKADSPERDYRGDFTLGVSSTYRSLATIGYLVERDASAFRSNLVSATRWRMRLFDRFDAGDPVSPSLVSMHTYKQMYDALASGDMGAAGAFAERMGGRLKVEEEHDRHFERAMGYALKAVFAADGSAAHERLSDLEEACKHSDYVNFSGYVPVLRAVVSKDSRAAEEAFLDLLSGHRLESKGRGLFSDAEDEFLCVWGIGVLNLAHMHGMKVQIRDPLIPQELAP